MFRYAKAVFPVELSGELNSFVAFRAFSDIDKTSELRITAADYYNVYVNGKFVAYGPARTAQGYARVDVLALGEYAGRDVKIEIAVAAYHCRTLSTVYQPGFLMAELYTGGEVKLYTGRDFECFIPECKLRLADRYSYQRHFMELWDLSRLGSAAPTKALPLAVQPKTLPRTAPYPKSREVMSASSCHSGVLVPDPTLPVKQEQYSNPMKLEWGRFAYSEVPSHPYEWVQGFAQEQNAAQRALPLQLGELGYAVFDLGRIEAGFIKLMARAASRSRIVIAFSEDCSPDKFSFTNLSVMNTVELTVDSGQQISFISFEPYVFRYAMVAVREGDITLDGFGIRTFECNTDGIEMPDIPDRQLSGIYRAAVRTFAHNAVDIYMDCPSRERAGWLCDSYFTARVEYELFGKTDIEDAFLENYRLYENQGELPQGMIPMCFPSSVELNGNFIPQWSMWYILELEEYLNVRNKKADRELFRKSVMELLDFYRRHENSDGLIERMPGFNFVEWSRANQWTKDVSYPTNFLYAAALEAVYKIYGEEQYLLRAEEVRRVAIGQSYKDGLFFDHAKREGGRLVRQNDCSEICQYYALLFADIDIGEEKYAPLRDMIFNFFGAGRKEKLEEIEPINAFIGVYLRIEALLKLGAYDTALADIRGFFGEMEELTGTLWEFRERKGSRDHGFASYALVAIKRCMQA